MSFTQTVKLIVEPFVLDVRSTPRSVETRQGVPYKLDPIDDFDIPEGEQPVYSVSGQPRALVDAEGIVDVNPPSDLAPGDDTFDLIATLDGKTVSKNVTVTVKEAKFEELYAVADQDVKVDVPRELAVDDHFGAEPGRAGPSRASH